MTWLLTLTTKLMQTPRTRTNNPHPASAVG